MIGAIVSHLSGLSMLARAGGTAALLALLVGSCAVRDWKIENKGAAKVVEASKQQGAKANAVNEKVRERASAPGAAERLRREPLSCRDCTGAVQGLATQNSK